MTALVTGELPDVERDRLEHHLTDCAACRHRLDALAAGSGNRVRQAQAFSKAGPPAPVPDWLPKLAEALAGQRLDANNPSGALPVGELFKPRQALQANSAADYSSRWARWFVADQPGRSNAGVFALAGEE